jgi:Effector protein
MTIILLPAQFNFVDRIQPILRNVIAPGGVGAAAADWKKWSECLEIKEVSFEGFITIQYFNFIQWLSVYVDVGANQWAYTNKEPGAADVEASIKIWRANRDTYLGTPARGGSVSDQLKAIAASNSGSAVLEEVKRARKGHTVSIYPDYLLGSPEAWAADSKAASKHGNQPGPGADVNIAYSPELWGKTKNTVGSVFPGSGADAILHHELVHASRDLRGVTSQSSVSGYKNVEEFMAVVITNIYMSETDPLGDLRGSYGDEKHPAIKLLNPDRFLDNWQHIHPAPRLLLKTFSIDQSELYEDLAFLRVAAPFNPIAQLDAERHPDKHKYPSFGW